MWSTADNEGLEHDESSAPGARAGRAAQHRRSGAGGRAATVPVLAELRCQADPLRAAVATGRTSARRLAGVAAVPPTATFPDPWADAARSVILVDLPSWPSAHRPHAWQQPPYMAPTLDLNVAFHRPTADEPWLLCDGAAPVSTRGLFGWTARVWSPGGASARLRRRAVPLPKGPTAVVLERTRSRAAARPGGRRGASSRRRSRSTSLGTSGSRAPRRRAWSWPG